MIFHIVLVVFVLQFLCSVSLLLRSLVIQT
jgi:hypothetical protein